MKTVAAIQTAHEQRLVVDELEVPDPRPDQVIVKLFSSGICHSQLHQMHNANAPLPGVPIVVRLQRGVCSPELYTHLNGHRQCPT